MSISTTPLWAEGAAVPQGPEPARLPARVDALIIGAGYTGLSAAQTLAAAGRATLVVDAGAPGAGCSGRNGGQVAYSIKPTEAALAARHGAAIAAGIRREGQQATDYLRELVAGSGLDAGWRDRGCFVGAHTPRHFERLQREAEKQGGAAPQRMTIVRRADQANEIASDFYHGGCVYEDAASVDPRRLLELMHSRALAAGATIAFQCPATALERDGAGFVVTTPEGRISTRQVLLATNGYSGPLSPWHRRRVIPIGSYQMATAPLGIAAVRALIPQGRNLGDTRRVVVYYRPSVDGERLVFGGRAALQETDPVACVPRLRQMLTEIFPQLAGVSITHAWAGWVAYTFDTLPHLGEHQGVHYSMGYCGQGVPLAPYFGHRIAQQMLGLAAGRTALDGLPFPTRPYYFGKPWFLGASVFAYRCLDRLGI